jgi:hypothetical protein
MHKALKYTQHKDGITERDLHDIEKARTSFFSTADRWQEIEEGGWLMQTERGLVVTPLRLARNTRHPFYWST